MNAWKRPLYPDGGRLPVVYPAKKPRVAGVTLPTRGMLSTTYDLSLHAFVSGFFLQDLLRHFTQNLLPLVSRSGVYLETMGHDRVLQIVNTFLLCEWSRGRIPLLCTDMALMPAVASDGEVWRPPQLCVAAAPGEASQAACGEQNGNGVASPTSVKGSWSESQSVDVVKFVGGGGRDRETQTTGARCCDQNVQTDGAALADPQVVDSRDICVQTEEVDHWPPPHSPACDRPQQHSVEPERGGNGGMTKQPAEKVPGLQPPHTSQQTVNNLTQWSGIPTKDQHGPTMLQNRSPTQTAANGFLSMEGFGQNHVEESGDTHVDCERTQCGMTLPTGETTLSGETLPSEDTPQHTDYPLQVRSIPSRITSGRGNDQALPRRESIHKQNGLNSVRNAECHVQMASGHPNPNPSPSNSQGTPQLRVNNPVNVQYGVKVLPGTYNQVLASSVPPPRNGPYPLSVLGAPRPCYPSLNRIPVRQCPPNQLMTNQQGMSTLPVGNNNVGQDSGLHPQGPPIHRTAAQPGIGQHLGSSDPRSNIHTSGNLIQLTGTPNNLTPGQVSSNVVSESTHWQCPPQNSATTMDSVSCGNPDPGVQLKSSAVETGVQSCSSAVNSSLLPGSDKSGEKSSPSCAQQQQMCNGPKPMYDDGSQFSDTSSVLAPSSVDEAQGSSTDCKEIIPGLPRQWNAAENVNQSRCPVHDASWKQEGIRASGSRDPKLAGVTDGSTSGDHRVADMSEIKPAVEWRRSPKEGKVSRAIVEQTGYIEALQRLLHEDKGTGSKQSASSLQPTGTRCDSVLMPPIDEIPLPDEEEKGLLPCSPEQDQNKLPVKQTPEKNDIHQASKVQPVDDMKQTLQKFIDRVCKSASAQQKSSNTCGHIPSLHDVPLPGNKEQNSFAHSPPCNDKNDEVIKVADSKVKNEVLAPSVGQINSPLTSVSAEPSQVGERNEQKEMKQTKRGMLRALVDQIQTYVDQLSGAYSSSVKSPPQEQPVCISQQAQEDATTANSLSQEQKVSKGLPPGSSRFAPYEVRNGKRCAEKYTSSSQNSDVNSLIKTLVMNEVPNLMRNHSNPSTTAIEEQCARLISRYSAKALNKKGRVCRGTETNAVAKRSRGTMTPRPHSVSRRVMTNTLEVSDASTVTNIVGRRERGTLTDNRRVQDASTTARRPQPCLSHSCQTERPTAEVGTATDTPTQQGTQTDSAERGRPAMTTAALVATQRTTHLMVKQPLTGNTAQLEENKPVEWCRALVPTLSGSVSRDSADHQSEDLAETSRPSEGEGTVRITIKVKVGKGSNIRLAS